MDDPSALAALAATTSWVAFIEGTPSIFGFQSRNNHLGRPLSDRRPRPDATRRRGRRTGTQDSWRSEGRPRGRDDRQSERLRYRCSSAQAHGLLALDPPKPSPAIRGKRSPASGLLAPPGTTCASLPAPRLARRRAPDRRPRHKPPPPPRHPAGAERRVGPLRPQKTDTSASRSGLASRCRVLFESLRAEHCS